VAVDDALSVHPTQAVFTSGLDLGTIAAGRVVEARVVSLAEGQAILTGRFGTLQVDLGSAKAAVGDMLRFEVQAVSGGDGKAGVALSLLGKTSPTTADPGAAAVAADTPARALAEAVGRAAARQSGLAPLFASLAGLAAAPQGQVPEPVRTLVAQLMNTRLGADGAPTAATVARGFQGSGLFLESRQAAATNVAPSEDLKAGLKALGDALTRWLGPSARADATAGSATANAPAIIRMPTTVEGGRAPAAAPGGTPVPSASTLPAGANPAGAVGGGGTTSPVAAESAVATTTSAAAQAAATPGGRIAAQAYGAGRTDRPEPATTLVPSPRLASAAYGAPRAAPASGTTVATPTTATATPTVTVATTAGPAEVAATPVATATTTTDATGAAVRPTNAASMPADPAKALPGTGATASVEPEAASAVPGAPMPASTAAVAAAPDLPDAPAAAVVSAEASPAPTVAAATTAASPAGAPATVVGPAATVAEAVGATVAAMAQALIEEGVGTSAAAQTVVQTVVQAEERGRVDRASRPPPPRRGSAPRGQAALPADTVEASSDGIEGLARRALARVDGALQRILLEQYAVLDRHDDATAAVSAATRNGAWTAEIPIATRDGTAVMQMTVERDGGGRGGKAVKDGSGDWRVRFALDVEPVGAVTAQIGLAGEHLSIGLWIERPEMALRLAGAVGELRGALEAVAIPVEAIHVTAGRAPEAARPPASGRFVDVSL